MRNPIFLVAAIAMVVAFSHFVRADEKASPAIGAAAPTFTLTDQDGKAVSLDSFKDKVVVLEWFHDGCPFVQKFYKEGHMNRLANKYIEKGVVWLAVNSTNTSDVAHNKKAAGDYGMNRPVLDDSKGVVGHQYAATNTPGMYVINKGILVYKGAIDDKPTSKTTDIEGAHCYVAAALDEVLAGKTVTTADTKPYGCTVKYAK